MKRFQRILCFLLSMSLLLGLAITAVAEGAEQDPFALCKDSYPLQVGDWFYFPVYSRLPYYDSSALTYAIRSDNPTVVEAAEGDPFDRFGYGRAMPGGILYFGSIHCVGVGKATITLSVSDGRSKDVQITVYSGDSLYSPTVLATWERDIPGTEALLSDTAFFARLMEEPPSRSCLDHIRESAFPSAMDIYSALDLFCSAIDAPSKLFNISSVKQEAITAVLLSVLEGAADSAAELRRAQCVQEIQDTLDLSSAGLGAAPNQSDLGALSKRLGLGSEVLSMVIGVLQYAAEYRDFLSDSASLLQNREDNDLMLKSLLTACNRESAQDYSGAISLLLTMTSGTDFQRSLVKAAAGKDLANGILEAVYSHCIDEFLQTACPAVYALKYLYKGERFILNQDVKIDMLNVLYINMQHLSNLEHFTGSALTDAMLEFGQTPSPETARRVYTLVNFLLALREEDCRTVLAFLNTGEDNIHNKLDIISMAKELLHGRDTNLQSLQQWLTGRADEYRRDRLNLKKIYESAGRSAEPTPTLSTPESELQYRIRRVTEYLYDANTVSFYNDYHYGADGRLADITKHNPDGSIEQQYVYEYNPDGTPYSEHLLMGQTSYLTRYYYNSAGEKIAEKFFAAGIEDDGMIEWRHEYTYDNGLLMRDDFYTWKHNYFEYEYDHDLLISVSEFQGKIDSTGYDFAGKRSYLYDGNGRLSRTELSTAGSYQEVVEYRYDEYGNLAEETAYSPGALSSRKVYEYEPVPTEGGQPTPAGDGASETGGNELYLPLIRSFIAEDAGANGMLCDLDGDADDELLIFYVRDLSEEAAYVLPIALCDVYDIRDGRVEPVFEKIEICNIVGGNLGEAGLAHLDGKPYLYTRFRSAYNIGMQSIDETILYDCSDGCVASSYTYRYTMEIDGSTEQITEESYELDGSPCSDAEYSTAFAQIAFVDGIDSFNSGRPLDEMLETIVGP